MSVLKTSIYNTQGWDQYIGRLQTTASLTEAENHIWQQGELSTL